jgi:DNA-binding NarL/FixJ family response regulator
MKGKMPLKIIIADDHPLLVDGLRRVLEEMKDVEVSEPVGNGRLLLVRLRESPVDMVLLDLQMPQLDGLETLRILQKEFPRLKVLVFTNYNQPEIVARSPQPGRQRLPVERAVLPRN